MMQTAYFGWEAGSLQNSNVRAVYGPLPTSITISGYQFDMGARQNTTPPLWGIGSSPIADILFQAAITQSNDWSGGGGTLFPAATKEIGGTNPTSLGASPAQDSVFATAILKMWVPQSVNKSIVMSGLSLVVPAGYYISFFAGHSGAPADFEFQGVLFYA